MGEEERVEPAPRGRSLKMIALVAAVALLAVVAGVALLVNILERKEEARAPTRASAFRSTTPAKSSAGAASSPSAASRS